MTLNNNGRASSEPLPDSFRRHRRGSGSGGRLLGEVDSSATITMEPKVVTVRNPEQRLYPVILRNNGGQHILFKVKIRRRQVEDWIVYPVMGVISPLSTQTVYLTRQISVPSLYRSQSGPLLVETSVVSEADAQRRSPQHLWDSISTEGRANVQSRVLPIEVQPDADANCSAPSSPITPTISRPSNSVNSWLSSLDQTFVPPADLPTTAGVSIYVLPPSPVNGNSPSTSLSLPTDGYISPPPPYEKFVGYSSGPRDLRSATGKRQKALYLVQ